MFLTDVMTYLMKGTLTNIKGVLRGDGKTLGEIEIDTKPTSESKNLIESGAVKEAVDDSYFSMTKGSLSTGSDLNDVAPGTIHLVTSDRTYLNAPNVTALWGLLVCFSSSKTGSQRFQFIFGVAGRIYYRYNSGTSWSDWRVSTFDNI